MSNDLDMKNNDANISDLIGSPIASMTAGPFSRRRLLAGAGVLGAALVAAACGSDTKTATSSTTASTTGSTTGATTASTTAATTAGTTAGTTMDTTTATSGATDTTGAAADGGATDAKIAQLAAGLEVLAVGTYKAALDAATAGSLGTVPPAVATFVQTAMDQHQQQLDAWNKVLTGAGAEAVTEPNATLKPTVDAAFAKVTDVAGAATLALMLEQIASATYQSALPVITDKDAILLAGSIQIIDAQHAAVLLFVLGQYPVPDTFAPLDKAVAA
ncbi:MAG: Ferritin-like protein [Acidimicrobiales bacterium]|nr:Ferritin-like protein [Acidimicrobiales bacterium]